MQLQAWSSPASCVAPKDKASYVEKRLCQSRGTLKSQGLGILLEYHRSSVN